mgnify:CR=1 FL=1
MKPPVIILAGGFGTRLKSKLPNLPKALAPVEGKPFLKYMLLNLARQGVERVIISTGYLGQLINEFIDSFNNEKLFKNQILTVQEKTPLGTGGAVLNVLKKINIHENFIVVNGDTWLDNFYLELISSPSPALGIIKINDSSRYGKVLLNIAETHINLFSEKTNDSSGAWISSGAIHLSAHHFNNVSEEKFSIEEELLPKIIEMNKLKAVKLDCNFIDIGIPSDYYFFKENFHTKFYHD